ncbi:MAG: radical SAM protein [Crenarchaeota archaeon]|nr:radical SAM protein [Thermoproteota archaeon]
MLRRCPICGREAVVSRVIGACADCVRSGRARGPERSWRLRLGLPPAPPRAGPAECRICVNRCRPGRGAPGFCGVWFSGRGGGLAPRTRGLMCTWYLDPHPTNCVATPVCPAATSEGYPEYTFTRGVERGYYNLAVFMLGCNLDCLFCQNIEHKTLLALGPPREYIHGVDELVEAAMDPRVTCICFFGGDPTPHMPLLLRASRRILEEAAAPKRICWETNGLASEPLMREAARLSLESGGIVKVDWKAWSPEIYSVLTGVDGEAATRALKRNTALIVDMWHSSGRRSPPLLVVSMLLVPGYVDEEEVYGVAEYLAGMDRDIPLVLLAFHPQHLMRDLPTTSRRHAASCIEAARRAGLRRVFLGNEWLLGDAY